MPMTFDEMYSEAASVAMVKNPDVSVRSEYNAWVEGFITPKIVITESLLRNAPPETMFSVLSHEMYHLKQRHPLCRAGFALVGSLAVSAVAWLYGPYFAVALILALVYIYAQMVRCQEMAADRFAGAVTGSNTGMIEFLKLKTQTAITVARLKKLGCRNGKLKAAV
jgi:Zn-dependent protease with chaperone function